jgi:FixJ family two-component response regulator
MTKAVLIDDDELMHLLWKQEASKHHIELHVYSTAEQFLGHIQDYQKNTPIYIDLQLGEGISGNQLCEKLQELTFDNLYICSGLPKVDIDVNLSRDRILGKKPPWGQS